MKSITYISPFNPISYHELNIIKAFKKQGYKRIYCVCECNDDQLISWTKKMVRPFSYIQVIQKSQIDSSIDCIYASDATLAHQQQIRYGNYLDLPFWLSCELNYTTRYYHEMLQHALKPKRYGHTISVKNTGVMIAKANHLDIKLVEDACLLHDVCKDIDDTTLYEYTRRYDSSVVDQAKPILHQYAGAYFVKHYLRYPNTQVIDAIAHHTTGTCNSLLAKTVYIADKCEPLRDYDSSAQLALACKNVTLGFKRVKQESEAYVAKQLEGRKNGN